MSSAVLVSSSGYSPVLQPTKECTIHQEAVSGIRTAYLRMRFTDHVPEACHLRFVPPGLKTEIGRIDDSLANTACWTYISDRPGGGDPYHLICIGEKCLSSIKSDPTNPGIQLNYLINLLEHEVGHLRHTERDFALIQQLAEAEKLSMGAINVGEDCRIEALISKERDHQFAWDTYRDPPNPESLSNPPNAMITARHFAGDRALVLAHLAKADLTEAHADCVVSYYHQLVAAPNTSAVVGIMRRFCDDFRRINAPDEESGEDGGASGSPSPEAKSKPSPSGSAGAGGGSEGDASTSGTPPGEKDDGTPANSKPADANGAESQPPTTPKSEPGKSESAPKEKAEGEPKSGKSGEKSVQPGTGADGEQDDSASTPGEPGAGSGKSGEVSLAPKAAPESPASSAGTSPPTKPSTSREAAADPKAGAAAEPTKASTKAIHPEQVIGEEPNDMELSERLAKEGDLLETIMKRCFDPTAIAVTDKKPQDGNVEFGMGVHTEVEYSAGGTVLGETPWGAIDRRRVDRSVATLLQAMRGRQEIITTDRPTRRLDPRLAIFGSDRPYKQKVDAEQGTGPLKLVIIMDCSGSMSSGNPDDPTPISEGRHFVAVINELAKRRRVEAILALSKVQQATAWCQAIRLPMPDKDILRITANGEGEGLAMALERLAPAIREADMTALYTDGHITDVAIDKEKLHRKGVHLYGLYVGPDSKSQNLRTHTDYPITASSLEVLTGRYARTLLSNRARRRVGA